MGRTCGEMDKKNFSEWDGLSIVCPDWDNMPDKTKKFFDIYGDPSRMKQEAMIFNVQKCSDDQ
jgi:hypothetical protein